MKLKTMGVAALLALATLNSGRSFASDVLESADDWLQWSDATRLAYVSGYLHGHGRGFRDGCEAGERIYSATKPEGLPGAECIPEIPKYSQILDVYVATITKYYRTYPEDGGVVVYRLLDGMSDGRNLTIRQMHEYFGPSARKTAH